MITCKISADFNTVVGKIKPMHCGNGGPCEGGRTLPRDFTEEFKYMGTPYSRLHDIEYPYGLNQFVDIHCIFPDFDADADDPDSYNFKQTDIYLTKIIESGSKIFYRLGESIDCYSTKLYVHPPKSKEKWASICEHIIMHYNEGWADGFHMGIEYWEIWNEADNKNMWTGSDAEFFELYRITANRLKKRFGDTIKVGGYAASGFYMLNRDGVSDWFKTLVPFMHRFLSYITAEETHAPIDFFSWHCYALTPEEVALHAKFARELIDIYNIKNCESILDEFNMNYSFTEFLPTHKGAFSDVAASMIIAQKSSIDMMMYYMFTQIIYGYNCAYSITGTNRDEKVHFAGIESFHAFNELYKRKNEVKTEGDIEGKLNALAAKDDESGAIMLVSREYEGKLNISVSGGYKSYSLKRVDDYTTDGTANISITNDIPLSGDTIELELKERELLLITLR